MEILGHILLDDLAQLVRSYYYASFDPPSSLLFTFPDNGIHFRGPRCYSPRQMIRFRLREWLAYRIPPFKKSENYNEHWYDYTWREALGVEKLVPLYDRKELSRMLCISPTKLQLFLDKQSSGRLTLKIIRNFRKYFPDDVGRVCYIHGADLNIVYDDLKTSAQYPSLYSGASDSFSQVRTKILNLRNKHLLEFHLDFSHNMLCNSADSLKQMLGDIMAKYRISSLNISYSSINDKELVAFVSAFEFLLKKADFRWLEIGGNYGANQCNLNKLKASFGSICKKICTFGESIRR